MRFVSSIAVAAVLALAACGQGVSTTATTDQTAEQTATATTADSGGESMSMSMSASASDPVHDAANCMAYTTLQRQAVLSGHAQGDAVALLRATAAWRASVATQPSAQEFYTAAMSAYGTMDQADLKAAADDCVARAPH